MGNLLSVMPLDAHTLYSVLTLTTTHDLARRGHEETQSHQRQSIVLPEHSLLLIATMVTIVQ